MAFEFVVTLVLVAMLLVMGLPLMTELVVGLFVENARELVPIEIAELPVLAGVVDPGVVELVPVEVSEIEPPVPAGVADPIELDCPLRFAVVVSWLLVLPTWPVWTVGLTWELVARFDFARDR